MYFRLRHILATGFPQKQLAVIRRLGNCLTSGRFGHLLLTTFLHATLNLPTASWRKQLMAERKCVSNEALVFQGVKKLKPQPLWLSTLQTLAAICNKSQCLSCY